jgi:hypothetical protein
LFSAAIGVFGGFRLVAFALWLLVSGASDSDSDTVDFSEFPLVFGGSLSP